MLLWLGFRGNFKLLWGFWESAGGDFYPWMRNRSIEDGGNPGRVSRESWRRKVLGMRKSRAGIFELYIEI